MNMPFSLDVKAIFANYKESQPKALDYKELFAIAETEATHKKCYASKAISLYQVSGAVIKEWSKTQWVEIATSCTLDDFLKTLQKIDEPNHYPEPKKTIARHTNQYHSRRSNWVGD